MKRRRVESSNIHLNKNKKTSNNNPSHKEKGFVCLQLFQRYSCCLSMAIPALPRGSFIRNEFPLLRDRLSTCLEHLCLSFAAGLPSPPGTGLISVSIPCHSMAASAVMYIYAHGIIYHGKGLWTDTTKKLRAIGLVDGDST